MNVGDVVTRNAKYKWCICEERTRCWCRKGGDWTIADARKSPSQSGTTVIASQGGRKTDWLDSEYFATKVQMELFRK